MVNKLLSAVLLVVATAIVGCGQESKGLEAYHHDASRLRSQALPPVSATAPNSCHARGSGELVLPDASCTPGAVNPDATQDNIRSTVCKRGWTKTIRPPVEYTNQLKLQQMAAYGESGSPHDYEEDHLISLELGGNPTDPKNLWPEPGASPNPKDKVENALNSAVCSGQMPLATAQQKIASDWIAAGKELGLPMD